MFQLSKQIVIKVTYRVGLGELAPEIVKYFLVAPQASVKSVMQQMAYPPKLMRGAQLQDDHDTLLFSLKENRKSEGRR